MAGKSDFNENPVVSLNLDLDFGLRLRVCQHDHIARVLRSKISNSEMTAPKFYMFKDHKKEEAWRPVVSGCSSNTLGLSNLLSEVIESLCAAVENPFEVISSEDMLYRIEELNSEIRKERKKKGEEGIDYDWRRDFMVIGSDVTALFPSLSAQAVRNQVRKSKMKWENVDDEWMRLYVHLNRDLCSDISSIKHLLPWKKKGRKGQEVGMGSTEYRQRYITPWRKKLLGLAQREANK